MFKTIDRIIIVATQVTLFVIGAAFSVLLFAGVIGRYLADFPVGAIEASARLLLVWFFLLGAGLALRQGMHVGSDFVRAALPRPVGRFVELLAHLTSLAFIALLLSGSARALSAAASQVEPALGVSGLWGILAVPLGAALLGYHQLMLIFERFSGSRDRRVQQPT
jgi:TRAP-type C4-dicarboxylate transport system permease small subunit